MESIDRSHFKKAEKVQSTGRWSKRLSVRRKSLSF
jgi:hypothetical protein